MTTSNESLNRTMQNALRSLGFDKVDSDTGAAAQKINAAASTILTQVGEIEGGLESLTAGLGAAGTALLDATTPALEDLVEAMPDSSDADLIAILGSTATTLDNAFTHIVAGSPSLEGLKAQLETAAGNINSVVQISNLKEAMGQIAGSDFINDIDDVAEKTITELQSAVTEVGTTFTTNFNQILSGGASLAGDIANSLTDTLSAAGSLVPTTDQIAGTFSLSPLQNTINTLNAAQPEAFAKLGLGGGLAVTVTNLLQDNRIDEAVNIVSQLPQNIGVSLADLQRDLSAIPLNIFDQLTQPLGALTATTQATTQAYNPTAQSQTVESGPARDSGPGRIIRTHQELNISMKSIKRPVTELVIYQRFANASQQERWDFDREIERLNADMDQRNELENTTANSVYKNKPQMHMYVDMAGRIIAGAPFEYEPIFGSRTGQERTLKVMFFSLFLEPPGHNYEYFITKAQEKNIGYTTEQTAAMNKIMASYKLAFPYGRCFYADVQNDDGDPESISTTLNGARVVESYRNRNGIQNYGRAQTILTKNELKAAVDAAIGVG